MLHFYSAQNELVNSRKAMSQCLVEALGDQDKSKCNLIIIHTTVGHNFRELLSEAMEVCPNATVVGCSGGGVIGKKGPSEKMRSLAIMAVTGSKDEFSVACDGNVNGDNSFETGRKVANKLKAQNPEVQLINVLASGIDIAADKVIEGIESVFGPDIVVFGGTSADNMKLKNTFQFHNDLILERGILLIGFSDPTIEMNTAVSHGSKPIGEEFTVTKSKRNEIIELDGKSAWEVLMDALDLPKSTGANEAVVVSAVAERIPEELVEEYGREHKLHTIFKVSDDRKSFYLPVDCQEGTRLSLVQRDEDLIFGGTREMMEKLTQRIENKNVIAVFHTDCVARGRMTFDKIVKDDLINNLQTPICKGKDIPWLGLYGFGEFTPLNGKNHFHTQTSSVYVLSRN